MHRPPANCRSVRAASCRDALALFAHTVKSTALYIGATALAEAAAPLERGDATPDPDDLCGRVATLQEQIGIVREGLIARFPDILN